MYKNYRVLVAGGASFIGSHLVEKLLEVGASVRVADDLSSGRLENLPLKEIDMRRGDLKDRQFTRDAVDDMDVVFQLAALHGGRGYITSHPVQCCTNMAIDQLVFEESYRAGVDRVCYVSSACVYPEHLQGEIGSNYLLKEEDADPFIRDRASPDLEYGWAKLMGEMTMKAYHRQYGMKTSSARLFTVYGPRENETHAIIALIAKAFIQQDPYEIWGTGEQDRNFTYVSDIVDGIMLTSEKVEDGGIMNVGREDRITINDMVELIFESIGWTPDEIFYDTSKPQGVASRAADLTKARELLNWEPKVSWKEGVEKTVEWYVATHDREEVKKNIERALMER